MPLGIVGHNCSMIIMEIMQKVRGGEVYLREGFKEGNGARGMGKGEGFIFEIALFCILNNYDIFFFKGMDT